MSGVDYSYITISQNEADQLKKKARRVDQAEAALELERLLAHERERRVSSLDERLTQQHERYNKHVNNLEDKVRSVEKNTYQKLKEQRKQFERKLKSSLLKQQKANNEQFKKIDQRITELDQTLKTDLATHKEEMEKALQEQGLILQDNIDQLADDFQQRLHHDNEIAQEWIKYLYTEINYISTELRHKLFSTGELDKIQERMRLAEHNIKQGVFQSAISTAQEAYIQAVSLREKLEAMELQWNYWHSLAQDNASAALLLLDNHKVIEYQVDQQTTSLDVNFWTEGAWQKLHSLVLDLQQQLNEEPCTLSLGDLEKIQLQCSQFQQELLNHVDNGKAALLSSIQRRDIQEMILEKMEDLGFHLIDSTYENEDYRRSYWLKLRNGNDEELVTQLEPTKEQFNNQLTFNFYDQSPNNSIRNSRLRKIQQSLEHGGINISPITCDPNYQEHNAPEERRDFKALRKCGFKREQT